MENKLTKEEFRNAIRSEVVKRMKSGKTLIQASQEVFEIVKELNQKTLMGNSRKGKS